MTITFGRCLALSAPAETSWDGDQVTFSGFVDPAITSNSSTVAKVIRQQLTGLADNDDEPVVPITSTDDSDIDGFYRIEAVNVSPTVVYLENGFMRWTVSATRIRSYGLPLQELTTGAVLRTNGHGITVPDSIVIAVYNNTQSLQMDSTLQALYPTMSVGSRSTSDGSVIIGRTPAPVALSTYHVEWYPGDYYKTGAVIEVQIGGTWYKVTGDQVAYNAKWRISNGIVRFTSQQTSGTHATLEVFNGSAWESAEVRHWEANTTGVHAGYGGLTILRNSADQVVVRAQMAPGATGGMVVDYSVKRGHAHIECTWVAVNGDWTVRLGCGFASTVASTDITGAIRNTANDANGNYLVFGVAAADSVDLVNGRVCPSADAASGSMFMGVSLNGSGAAGSDTPAELLDQFLGVTPNAQITTAR